MNQINVICRFAGIVDRVNSAIAASGAKRWGVVEDFVAVCVDSNFDTRSCRDRSAQERRPKTPIAVLAKRATNKDKYPSDSEISERSYGITRLFFCQIFDDVDVVLSS